MWEEQILLNYNRGSPPQWSIDLRTRIEYGVGSFPVRRPQILALIQRRDFKWETVYVVNNPVENVRKTAVKLK